MLLLFGSLYLAIIKKYSIYHFINFFLCLILGLLFNLPIPLYTLSKNITGNITTYNYLYLNQSMKYSLVSFFFVMALFYFIILIYLFATKKNKNPEIDEEDGYDYQNN